MTKDQVIQMARQRKVRLVLCGGYATSESDGQRHYVGPMALLHLYGVPAGTPYVIYPSGREEFLLWCDKPEDIQLHPMSNGKYSLVAAAVRAAERA